MAGMEIVVADGAGNFNDGVEAQYVEMMVPLYSYGCERKIKKALSHLKGIYSVNVDFKQQKVTVWGICNKSDVLSTIKRKRKGAVFWTECDDCPKGDAINIVEACQDDLSQSTTVSKSPRKTRSERRAPWRSWSFSERADPMNTAESVYIIYKDHDASDDHGGASWSLCAAHEGIYGAFIDVGETSAAAGSWAYTNIACTFLGFPCLFLSVLDSFL